MIENLDHSEDEFRSCSQKTMILQVILQIFCEMLIGGRKNVYIDFFFEVTNTKKSVQNYSSKFEGLLQKMVSKKGFMNQGIIYINGDGES